MTVGDGFLLKQGEGREGKELLQGLLERKNPRAGGEERRKNREQCGGTSCGCWAQDSATKLLFLLFAREERNQDRPGSSRGSSSSKPQPFYVFTKVFFFFFFQERVDFWLKVKNRSLEANGTSQG